jgi:bifunctional UDP-N-acetylglucosamine pyrophosphorylase/glucosamine-1-phosphate N-acetyltransferase
MKSERPKVLHELLGRPILAYVLNAAKWLSPERVLVVTGSGAEEVEEAFRGAASFVRQEEQLGTGHAVAQAEEALKGFGGPLVIVPGDAPLISPQTLLDFLEAHRVLGAALSVLTAVLPDPGSYGRVLRGPDGWLQGIVECRDATEEERQIREVNAGVYAGSAPEIFGALREVRPDNAQGEYYLTDMVGVLRARGRRAAAVTGPDPQEIQGINDREELWRAREVLRLRIISSWLRAGVTVDDPYTAVIEPSVRLEEDARLGPGVVLEGSTRVGRGARIGPYAVLRDSAVEARAEVPPHAFLEGAEVRRAPPGRPFRAPRPKKRGRARGARLGGGPGGEASGGKASGGKGRQS